MVWFFKRPNLVSIYYKPYTTCRGFKAWIQKVWQHGSCWLGACLPPYPKGDWKLTTKTPFFLYPVPSSPWQKSGTQFCNWPASFDLKMPWWGTIFWYRSQNSFSVDFACPMLFPPSSRKKSPVRAIAFKKSLGFIQGKSTNSPTVDSSTGTSYRMRNLSSTDETLCSSACLGGLDFQWSWGHSQTQKQMWHFHKFSLHTPIQEKIETILCSQTFYQIVRVSHGIIVALACQRRYHWTHSKRWGLSLGITCIQKVSHCAVDDLSAWFLTMRGRPTQASIPWINTLLLTIQDRWIQFRANVNAVSPNMNHVKYLK